MSLVRRGDEEITKRYRPRRLSEMVGNKATVKAMENSMKMGDSRQRTFLFFGSSGCGKTTLARIMAMGLNCEKGDTGEPCLECESCKNALASRAFHILELNLARFNKKEDAEGVVDEMGLTSLTGRNKVYIFDEAQMLTKQAQNLLLKHLEEPPPNTYIFICTTEENKIIKAIRNRCEQYEFKLPTENEVKSILGDVLKQEPQWADALSVDDKIKFVEMIVGTSVREVLKSFDKIVRGGIETLTFIQDDDPDVMVMCKYVVAGDWDAVVKEFKKHKKENPLNAEGLRRCLLAFLRNLLLGFGNNPGVGLTDTGVAIVEAIRVLKEPAFDATSAVPLITADIFEITAIMNGIPESKKRG